MVGLPGAGKSHWSRFYMKQHPEKQYKLLGTEELLACMIVSHTSRLHSSVLYSPSKMMFLTNSNYVHVCVEWWTEREQAATGLSVFN